MLCVDLQEYEKIEYRKFGEELDNFNSTSLLTLFLLNPIDSFETRRSNQQGSHRQIVLREGNS